MAAAEAYRCGQRLARLLKSCYGDWWMRIGFQRKRKGGVLLAAAERRKEAVFCLLHVDRREVAACCGGGGKKARLGRWHEHVRLLWRWFFGSRYLARLFLRGRKCFLWARN